MFYSTGQAARELGIAQARLRALCQAKAIPAEITEGGQFRISKQDVERFKRDGLPALPRPLPGTNASGDPHTSRSGRNGHGHPALLAEPSEQVVSAAENVVILENEVQALGLRRQKEEGLDWFREREEREAERQDAQERAACKRAAEEKTARQLQEWENRWHQFALDLLPRDVPPDAELEVPGHVEEALRKTNTNQPDVVVERLVRAAVETALEPWRHLKKIDQAVEHAINQLPYGARGWSTPTEWQLRATQAAHQAIRKLGEHASTSEIDAAACQAVLSIVREFQHLEQCKEIVKGVWCQILKAQPDERETGEEAVAKALAASPVGLSARELERVRDTALEPIRQRLETRLARERDERERDQDKRMRQQLLEWPYVSFPYDLTEEGKAEALKVAREAIGELPFGTPRQALETARDKAIAPILKAHEQRKKKLALIESAMEEIYPFLKKLAEEWEFDESTSALRDQVKPPIQEQLDDELSGNESIEQVRNRVRRLVREELGI